MNKEVTLSSSSVSMIPLRKTPNHRFWITCGRAVTAGCLLTLMVAGVGAETLNTAIEAYKPAMANNTLTIEGLENKAIADQVYFNRSDNGFNPLYSGWSLGGFMSNGFASIFMGRDNEFELSQTPTELLTLGNRNTIGDQKGGHERAMTHVMTLGFENTVNATQSLILGTNNTASGQSVAVLGRFNNVDAGTSAVMVGHSSKLAGKWTTGVGSYLRAMNHGSTVLGSGSSVKGSNPSGVALGSFSTLADVNDAAGLAGYLVEDKDKASPTWASTTAGVSIGGKLDRMGAYMYKSVNGKEATDGIVTRRLHYLAAGVNDTDAVNVAQLKALEKKLAAEGGSDVKAGDNILVSDDQTVSLNPVLTGITSIAMANDVKLSTSAGNLALADGDKTVTISHVKAGVADTDAVNVKQLSDLESSINTSIGNVKVIAGNANIQVGDDGRTVSLNPGLTGITSIAMGNDVKLSTSAGNLALADGDKTITISHVKAGVNDTDAVNVSQLNQVKNDINTSIESVKVKAGDNILVSDDQTVSVNPELTDITSIDMGNDVKLSTADGKLALADGDKTVTISHVKAGVNDTDAVNMSQLNAVKTTVEDHGNRITNIENTLTDIQTVAGKHSEVAAGTFIDVNETEGADGQKIFEVGLNAPAQSAVKHANQFLNDNGFVAGDTTLTKGALTLGDNTVINKTGVTFGDANGVNVGLDMSKANTVTLVGQGDKAVTITNVADGVDDHDAVNVSQLNKVDARVDDIESVVNNFGEGVNQEIRRLDKDIGKAGANAAAIAALHPQDFDDEHKWTGAAAIGHYKGEQAIAVGAFYRPTNNFMFSVGSSFIDSKDSMFNVGMSYRFGAKQKYAKLDPNQMQARLTNLTVRNRDLEARVQARDSQLEERDRHVKALSQELDRALLLINRLADRVEQLEQK